MRLCIGGTDLKNRQIYFFRRPDGNPTAEVFQERVVDVGVPGDGEILCRNLTVSVDPYLRLKMYERRSYTPPLRIGEAIPGRERPASSRANGSRSMAAGSNTQSCVPRPQGRSIWRAFRRAPGWDHWE